jgi:hypothetical protein
MTSRERFHRTLAGLPVDRPPLWEEGIREDVRETWSDELHPDAPLPVEFCIDHREVVQPDIRNARFRIVEPNDDDPPANALSRYPDDWDSIVPRMEDRDFPVGLWMSRGLLLTLGVGEWASLVPVLTALADEPDRCRSLMTEAARFSIAVLERAFNEIDPDFVLLSEPIASPAGPVVGPWTFRDACAESYDLLVEYARERGVQWIVFMSYGDTCPLLPDVLKLGCNVVWCGETGNSLQHCIDIRRELGADFGLIGGIDTQLLTQNQEEIVKQVKHVVPELLAYGRHLPLLDGRVRNDVDFPAYQAYRLALADAVSPGGSGIDR